MPVHHIKHQIQKSKKKLALRQLQVTTLSIYNSLQSKSHDSDCIHERVLEQRTSIAALNCSRSQAFVVTYIQRHDCVSYEAPTLALCVNYTQVGNMREVKEIAEAFSANKANTHRHATAHPICTYFDGKPALIPSAAASFLTP